MIVELIKMMTENGVWGYFMTLFALLSLMLITLIFLTGVGTIIRLTVDEIIKNYYNVRDDYLARLDKYIKDGKISSSDDE